MPLHPLIAKMMEGARAAGKPALSAGTPQDARTLVAAGTATLGEGPPVGLVTEVAVPSRAGTVPARLYRPAGQDPVGLVVYLHGGGWVCGSVADFDLLARALARRTGCAVLAVDYRLAPEHPFPAGLEDCEDAITWADASLPALFGRRLPLVVAGDSAGGNLATVAAARLRGRVAITLQCLLYPVTDADFERPSYHTHAEDLPLTRADMAWFFGHYAPTERWLDADIAVLRRTDLTGMPPAWIAVAEYDVLCDEGEAYARRLADTGVPVTCVRVAGLPHGFVRLFNLLPEADAAVVQLAQAIRDACHS